MKKVVTVQEVDGEGLVSLLGKPVMLFCLNYIYAGTLVGVNEHDVLLEDAGIVYETGKLKDAGFTDFQKFSSKQHYVRIAAIESYGEHA